MSPAGEQLRFLPRIPIDVPNTLSQLLGRFGSVREGIPELVKNAKDQYARLGIADRDQRVILIALSTSRRSVAVIDFAGATKDDFEKWVTWSDPRANRRDMAADIEGGHGNGGKAFMVTGSTLTSSLESCCNGRRTKMGYRNDADATRYCPAYFVEDGEPVRDVLADGDISARFERTMKDVGVRVAALPGAAIAALDRRRAYTIAKIDGIRDWSHRQPETVKRMVAELREQLAQHPQMALSLESCTVWLIVDGRVAGNAPLTAAQPRPFPGFEEPVVVPVPAALEDPSTREMIHTGSGDPTQKFLRLQTSYRSLRMEDTKPLNVIRIRNVRNIVAGWSVADLHPRAESAYIFGLLQVPALEGDELVGADRVALADTPLTRALRAWTAAQVKELSTKIQTATAREHRAEDRDRVNASLDRFRELMSRFLNEGAFGAEGTGPEGEAGSDGDDDDDTRKRKQRGKQVSEIIVERGAASIALAAGTTIPFVVQAFEVRPDGSRLPAPRAGLVTRAEPSGIIEAHADWTLTARAPGTVELWVEDPATGIVSNRVTVESVACSGAAIKDVPERLLLQGERVRLSVEFATPQAPRRDLLVEASIDELDMGRVNRNALFTAGTREGTATVRIRYAAAPEANTTAVLRIGADRVPHRTKGHDGGEIPLILLCGTAAPGKEDYPPEQRTIVPSEHNPTIIDFEPEFEHVIFINPDSRESTQAREGKGGRRGVAGIGTASYCQFLALKCFEILKRLRVFSTAKDETMTELQFRERFAQAETDCAPFIEQAYGLARTLMTNGESDSE